MINISIVSDATTLIVLGKLDRYSLLENIFDKIYIPLEIMNEVLKKDDGIWEKITAHEIFEIKSITDTAQLSLLYNILDKGESEAIILAKELDMLLLIDEKKGRAIAKNMGLDIIGLIGILILNVKKNKISIEESIVLLDEIKRSKFRISKKLEESFLIAIKPEEKNR